MPTKTEKDVFEAAGTTGHEWDGIKEFNNPLPKWWLYILYASILFSIVYWVLFPAWPSLSGFTKGVLGWTQHARLADDLADARAKQAAFLNRIDAAAVDEIRADKELLDFAIAGGRVQFAENCVPCHGAGGAGAKGYPSLADDRWLWGGTPADIEHTIRVGIRADNDETRFSEMPRFGTDEILETAQIADVAEHVLAISGGEADAAAAARGAAIFAQECAACHGDKGQGDMSLGAPRLSDAIWLHGGDRDSIIETITKARNGVMPSWSRRLDPGTVKMLAVYVHALGGGQ